jgi:hypothetical protein
MWAALALCAPFLVHAGGALGEFWYVPVVAFAWPWTSLSVVSAAAGLFLLARKISSQEFEIFISSISSDLQF